MTAPEVSNASVSKQGHEKCREEHVSRQRWISTFALLLPQKQTHEGGVCGVHQALMPFPLSLWELLYSEQIRLNFLWPELMRVFRGWVYVWPHQRPVDQDRGPARPGSGLPVLDHSATQWMWGCNSPSVCGLGWCRGWGELGVSHGKAGFIVSLWEWWIWERERERDTFLTFKNTLYLHILPNWQVKNIIKDRYYKRLKPGKFYSR